MNKKIMVLLIALFTFAVMGAINVSAVACYGNTTDEGGCTWGGTVVQTEDLDMTGTISGIGTWDCNGYKLTMVNGQTLFNTVGDDLSNGRVKNCEITSGTGGGEVWYLQQVQTNGYVQNNFIIDSEIYSVGNVMRAHGLNHVSYSFQTTNNGVVNSTLHDITGNIVWSSGAYNQDGVGSMILEGNNITNVGVGARKGHSASGLYCDNQGTLSGWIVKDNTFTNMTEAGVFNMQGCGSIIVDGNTFDGENSGILSVFSTIYTGNTDPNTYLNGANGGDGCIEPPVYGYGLVVSTPDRPFCDGNWTGVGTIIAEPNAKIYPQTAGQVNLISNSGTGVFAENLFTGTTSDNVEVTDLNFYNFSNAILMSGNCFNSVSPISDAITDWFIHGNKFYGDKDSGTFNGIYNNYDDPRYCAFTGNTYRDNEFHNLTTGIYFYQHTSDNFYNNKIYSTTEVSFNDFYDNTNGIKEDYTLYTDTLLVFNNFYDTNNSVLHSGYDWFGNVNYGGSYVQNQNDCQYPDLLKFYDRDVTLCSGTYTLASPSEAIFPMNNVKIFCDETIMYDNVPQSSPAVLLFASYYTGGYYKGVGANNVEIEGCTFRDFQAGVEVFGANAGAGIGTVEDFYFHDNVVENSQYGIFHTNSYDYDTNYNNYRIEDNIFYNQSIAGLKLECARRHDGVGAIVSNWIIDGNNFTDSDKGIYVNGCDYTTYCGTNPYNVNITNNYFSDNQYHIDINHPDVAGCSAPSYPRDIDAHNNIFERNYGAFAVKNTAPNDQDFENNNWKTGFTGIIDNGIFDFNDNAIYGEIDYIPLSGYTLVFGTPVAVLETWETGSPDSDNVFNLPVTYESTGYSGSYTFVGDNLWKLARTTSSANGNVYLSNDATCLNTYCYKADVGSLNVNPQYTRLTHFFTRKIDFQDDTLIEFSIDYESDYWQSGGAVVFRDDNDDIVLQIDLGLTNESLYASSVGTGGCSIQAITGDPKEGLQIGDLAWTDYSFEATDIESACPQYSTISDATDIDRVEFVFGGTRLGVLGNIVWYVDNINVENVEFQAYPPNTPPQGSVVLWKEEFGTSGSFNFFNAQCLLDTDGMSYAEYLSQTPKWTNGDHDWACYYNNSGVSSEWESEYNDVFVSSPIGIKHSISSGSQSGVSSFTTADSSLNLAITGTDHFLFTCTMDDAIMDDSYAFLMFGQSTVDTSGFYTGMISLKNGGCAYNSSLGYGDQIDCCELTQIVGYDCNSERATIDFSQQDVDDNCIAEGLSDAQFSEIDRIDLVAMNPTTSADNWFIDDLYIYSTGLIVNNSLPQFVILSAIPNPVNVTENVNWGWNVFDPDDPANETYTAFDCEDDGVLDYGWALRGNVGSGGTGFDCVYATEGTKTGRLWFTDVFHYPTYNTSATSTVDVLLVVEEPSEAPPQGGSCAGFVSPVCTGNETCWFYDNFNYNTYMFECNGWDGSGDAEKYHPVDGNLKVIDFALYEDSLEWTGDRITTNEYLTFDVEFDVWVNWADGSGVSQVFLIDNQDFKYSMNFAIDNYVARAFDYGGAIILGTLTPSTWHTVLANVDLESDTIVWWLDGDLKGSTGFYDSGEIDAFNELNIYVSDVKGVVKYDDVKVIFKESNPNATTTNQTTYVYNPNLFCAINWTAQTGDRFDEANCEARGFSTDYPLIGLCVPRACLQDLGSVTISWATSNIFTTIIIVTAFILIAPLIVALAKKR